VLKLTDVHAYYGTSHVLQGVSLEVRDGEIVALLGRNGMGKTTTLKAIMGFLRPRGGRVDFNGRSIGGLRPHQVACLGIGYVPENRRIFPGLSVLENLELGLSNAARITEALRKQNLERVFHHFPILREKAGQQGRNLSGGQQQMLTIARAMMGETKLILMDEPTQGLAPALVREIRDIIRELKGLGITILLVEQNARVALNVADRGYIMEKGQVVFEGSAEALRTSDLTKERLGV
jgi:branched-chain amino acid transport system ATP-binding protein